ncbi:MAG: hypothetical protein Q8S26_09995 [Azonexus sp.]|nr:hypothetical protein [Azonexus sp.]
MTPFFEILTWVTFAVAMVIAPVAWFRMVRAKTRPAYWKNIALFVGPILLVFLFANAAGLMPEAPTPPAPPSPQDVLGEMPTSQIVLLALVAALWIGGGNLLFHFHNRRLGKKWWQAMNPFNPPFKDFNTREWLILVALAIVSLGLMALAISVGLPA